jgi:hypothetical protein
MEGSAIVFHQSALERTGLEVESLALYHRAHTISPVGDTTYPPLLAEVGDNMSRIVATLLA